MSIGHVIVRSAVAATLCAGALAPASAPPNDTLELPDGVTVFVEYPRYLNLWRRVDVAVDNQTDNGFTVLDLALRTPLFEELPPDEPDYTVLAHRRQDVPATLGAAVCPAPEGPSMVELTIEYEGERRHGVVAVDADPLQRVNTRECAERRAFDTVDITFGPRYEPFDGGVSTTIELRRRDRGRVTLTAVRGSVIFNITTPDTAPDTAPLAVLDTSNDSASVPVEINVARCGAHAASESKRSFQFAMWVTIDDSEEIFVIIEPTGDLRAHLEQVIVDCLESSGDPT